MPETILEVNNLKKKFKYNLRTITVLEWVNLTVSKWEIYWFLGPNWSWKTTTLKCILGFLKYNEWEINLFGKKFENNKETYQKIGYAPENTYFYDHLNGIEFLIFMGQLNGMTKQKAELVGMELIKKVWLENASDKFVKYYSKGMKQRLGLAASLINDPEIIFWDEPMSWLDPLWRVLVKKLMVELKEQGKTIFFNTHILSDVQEIADSFSIIYEGNMLYEGKVSDLKISLEEFFINTIKDSEKEDIEEEEKTE